MSGQESQRGYLFQSLIAVLRSMKSDWISICVEPKTDMDKIDIIWTNTDEENEVCQVKSSINNFSTNDILRWIKALVLDDPNAINYSLILVGNSTSATKTFFNSIGTKNQTDFKDEFQEIFLTKDKISVVFEPNNIDTLEGALISGLDQFLYTKAIQADFPTKKLIVNGMVNQIIKISTAGKSMGKIEFENHLLEWLTFNYSRQISLNKTKLELNFYYDDILKFEDTASKIKMPDITKSNLYKSKRRQIKKLFNKISAYNFEPKNFEKPINNSDIFSLSTITFKNPFEYSDQQVIINDYEIEQITKNCQRILEVKPDIEFFNFGELKESKTMGHAFPLISNLPILNGSEEEKEKRELYNDFGSQIFWMIDFLNFWKKLSKLSLFPIVLSNKGKAHKTDIKIQLFFPKDIKLYKAKNFPIPKSHQILKDLNSEDSFLFRNVRHKQNSVVNEYYSGYVMAEFPNFGLFGFERKGYEKDKYRSMLDYYFDYSYYYDNHEYNIVECQITELNTNDTISLPSYIFFKSKMDYTLEYKITCKNEPETLTGTLYYKVNGQ